MAATRAACLQSARAIMSKKSPRAPWKLGLFAAAITLLVGFVSVLFVPDSPDPGALAEHIGQTSVYVAFGVGLIVFAIAKRRAR